MSPPSVGGTQRCILASSTNFSLHLPIICVTIQQSRSEIRSIDCEVQSEKGTLFLLFSIVLRIFQLLYNVGTTAPIQVRFSVKCTSPNEDFKTENVTFTHMINFRLISLNHITLCCFYILSTQCIPECSAWFPNYFRCSKTIHEQAEPNQS